MDRKLLALTVVVSAGLSAACGSSATNDQRSNANTAVNRPASPSPTTEATTATTPKPIPSSTPAQTPVVSGSNGNTSPAERPRVVEPKSTVKPAQPTSSIPSDEEMRKAFSRPATREEVNDPSMMRSTPMMKSKTGETPAMRSKPTDTPTMKSNRKLGGKPN